MKLTFQIILLLLFKLSFGWSQFMGIGTYSPKSELHLHSLNTSSATFSLSNNITTDANNRGAGLRMLGGNFYLENRENGGSTYLNNNGLIGISISKVNSIAENYVGIGTNTPFSQLHVHSIDSPDAIISLTNSVTTNLGGALRMINKNLFLTNHEIGGTVGLGIGSYELLTIKNFKIGIGTVNPIYHLDIRNLSNNTYVMNVNNTGNGNGIVSTIDGIGANFISNYKSAIIGVSQNNNGTVGVDTGNGIGVFGDSNTGTGVRAQGHAGIGLTAENNNTTFPSALLENLNSNGIAVKIIGGIQVAGSNRPVFQHTATADNIVGNSTEIPITTFANNVTDMLIITPIYNGVLLTKTIGVDFVGTSWRIFIQDQTNMPVGAKFNVFVVKQ